MEPVSSAHAQYNKCPWGPDVVEDIYGLQLKPSARYKTGYGQQILQLFALICTESINIFDVFLDHTSHCNCTFLRSFILQYHWLLLTAALLLVRNRVDGFQTSLIFIAASRISAKHISQVHTIPIQQKKAFSIFFTFILNSIWLFCLNLPMPKYTKICTSRGKKHFSFMLNIWWKNSVG